MSTKALKSQLLAAVAMVLVAAIALGSATFAWFASNTTVSATGVNVKTVVADNLMISDDTLENMGANDYDDFKTTHVAALNKVLEPVSTVDGENFFYTAYTNVDAATGDTKTNTFTAYDATAFATAYGVDGAVGYVDYTYQLMAVNSSEDIKNINLDTFKLTYAGEKDGQAFRAAIFANDVTTTDATELSLLGIYTVSGAKNFTEGYAVANPEDVPAGEGVEAKEALGEVIYNAAPITLQAAASKNTIYKIVVRLWLEGEDNTCNNTTYADLKNDWVLDMAWSLGDKNTVGSLQNLTIAESAVTYHIYNRPLATTGTDMTKTIDGVTYSKIDMGTGNESLTLYVEGTNAPSSSSRIYNIGADNLVFEVTNQCDWVAPAST